MVGDMFHCFKYDDYVSAVIEQFHTPRIAQYEPQARPLIGCTRVRNGLLGELNPNDATCDLG
jgi:hypothetical protein